MTPTDATRSRWGSIAIENVRKAGITERWKEHFRVSLYCWRPSREIAVELPNRYSLSLYCLTDKDGIRRFRPIGDPMDFIGRSYLLGLALLSSVKSLTNHELFSYRIMSLLYKLGPRLREHLDRSFRSLEDLRLPTAARMDHADEDILPDDIGLDSQGRGDRWNIRDLLAHGKDAAERRDLQEPSRETLIRLGLWEAACRNPLLPTSLKADEIRATVRLGVFDPGPSTGVRKNSRLKEKVQERLFAALEKHSSDSDERFHRWFFTKLDNIVHQISKQQKGGGPIRREQVRQLLLETVVDSWDYMAGCTFLAMQAFAEALPAPLSVQERQIFSALYFNQNYLSDIPLILLHARLRFLRQAIVDLLDDPTDGHKQGALLRLLVFYGEMCSKRRQADREFKSRSQHRNRSGKVGRRSALGADEDIEPSAPKGKKGRSTQRWLGWEEM